MGRFDEQVAVVTGGATGVGLATARALAAEGAEAILAERRPARGEEAAAAIQCSGGRAGFVRTDVADDEQVAALARQAAGARGRIDV